MLTFAAAAAQRQQRRQRAAQAVAAAADRRGGSCGSGGFCRGRVHGGGTCGVWQRRRQRWVWRQHWQQRRRLLVPHAACGAWARRYSGDSPYSTGMWRWCVWLCGHGMWGGLEKTVCGHAMHTPGTHQAHTRHMPGRHTSCIWHAHTMHTLAGHAHTMLVAHIGAPLETPLQNKCYSATKPLSLLATRGARPPRFTSLALHHRNLIKFIVQNHYSLFARFCFRRFHVFFPA